MSLDARSISFAGRFFCATILLLSLIKHGYSYTPPNARVEPLSPKGIRISVPDEDGISLVAFHVKINDDFTSLEAGTIAVDIIKAKNGRWTYEDRKTRLKSGDVVYYWVHVVYDGLGYNLLNQEHRVTQFFNYDGTPATSTGDRCSQSSVTQYIGGNGERKSACAGQVIFEDNFDNLDPSRWVTVEEFSRAPDYEFVVYIDSVRNVEVKDGQLHLKPNPTFEVHGIDFIEEGPLVLERCTGIPNTEECKRVVKGSQIIPPIMSGQVNTKGLFSFTYGRIQVRAKFPTGDWLYPVISLKSPAQETGGTYYEIRIGSAVGNRVLRTYEGADISGHVLTGGVIATNIHEGQIQATNRATLPKKKLGSLWADDYHLYELEWRPDRVVVKVDGIQYGEQAAPNALQKPFYISLGVAAGGHTEFPDLATNGTYSKPWRNVEFKALYKFHTQLGSTFRTWGDQNLHVDFIKVYAL